MLRNISYVTWEKHNLCLQKTLPVMLLGRVSVCCSSSRRSRSSSGEMQHICFQVFETADLITPG